MKDMNESAHLSRITIHMVSSLDGFIATKDNNVSWLEPHDHFESGITLSEEAITAFIQSIDCYIMGSHTYELALKLGWPYGDTPVVVITSRVLASTRKNVRFYNGDLNALVEKHLQPNYSNIWLVGGAMLVKAFLRLNLADEIIVSIMPILLGDGTLFFDYIGKVCKLHLKDTKAYTDGMIELCYEIKK